jgi:hypothetical protein
MKSRTVAQQRRSATIWIIVAIVYLVATLELWRLDVTHNTEGDSHAGVRASRIESCNTTDADARQGRHHRVEHLPGGPGRARTHLHRGKRRTPVVP